MKTLKLAVGSLLLFTGLALGRVSCEAASTHQIGWCMDPGNEQDREDCPVEYHDWDTPVDDECPSEDVRITFGAYCQWCSGSVLCARPYQRQTAEGIIDEYLRRKYLLLFFFELKATKLDV